MDDSPMARRSDAQPMLLDLDDVPQTKPEEGWDKRLLRALAYQDPAVVALAEEAVHALPGDPDVLMLTAVAMLLTRQPPAHWSSSSVSRSASLPARPSR